jgi:hypothetical protein
VLNVIWTRQPKGFSEQAMAAKRSSAPLARVVGNLSMLMARLVESWRTIRLLTHKATALSPIACVLLPALSTVDDFRTCALPRLTTQSCATQCYELDVGDRAEQDPCSACSRQRSVADAADVTSPLCVQLQLLWAISVDRHAAEQLETFTLRHGRAPPPRFPL